MSLGKSFSVWTAAIMPILVSCSLASPDKGSSQEISGWKAVYSHNKNGNPFAGSIDALITGIRNGYDLRVGWGWKKNLGDSLVRLEHLAEPLFITIIQEKDVSVVIKPHPLLESYFDINQQKFAEGGHIWQCVLTTRGVFNAQVFHRTTGELLKNWPQKHNITWFLEYPPKPAVGRKPLYKSRNF